MPFKDPAEKAAYMLRWQAANREKVRAANAKWQRENPETRTAINTRYRRARGTVEAGSPEHSAKMSASMSKRYPWPDRFWSKVNKDGAGGCWLWTASVFSPSGYGKIRLDGRQQYAHRVAYKLEVGPIPDGLEIDHLCFVRACVNPAHLEPVTAQENTRRANVRNGR